jgi:hypothetical protein
MMRSGQIDRTQLDSRYNAQPTDEAVHGLSRYLKEHDYGASPTSAKLLPSRSTGDQTFYVMKLIFPRGDAGSLLIGLNPEGKITSMEIMTMAGD